MGINPDSMFKKIRIHNINPEKDMWEWNLSSKLNATWDFLTELKDLGRKYAEEWLDENYEHIGVKATCDIRGTFL